MSRCMLTKTPLFRTTLVRLGCAVVGFLVFGLFPASGAPAIARTVHVEPRESGELLANPGMGWQTFHQFANEDRNLQGLPSASAYFRFYWREIEPQTGRIDFAKFDELLAHAHRAGQKLAFRIMCTGSGEYMDVPAWLKEQGCRGVEFRYGGRNHWVPDFADARFQEAHFRLIRELGRRYNGHPDLDLVDIGSVGLWGEWHMSSTIQLDTGKAVPLPSLELRLRIIEAWREAFPRTSKVILIGSEEGMVRAAQAGYGWRADCLGDMGGFSKTWNHMDNYYRQALTNAGAMDVWKTAPVAFETCWDMRKWKEAGWDIRHIFDYGLQCHASYLNNKSAPIPEGTRGEIEHFLRRLGYRLVLRSLDHAPSAKPGHDLNLATTWENAGVAPPYRDYPLAVRLKSQAQTNAQPIVLISHHSIQGWLPGPRNLDLSLGVPASVPAGRYELAIGVVDPATHIPAVRLAIAGRNAEGWYAVSSLELEQ